MLSTFCTIDTDMLKKELDMHFRGTHLREHLVYSLLETLHVDTLPQKPKTPQQNQKTSQTKNLPATGKTGYTGYL